MDRPVEKFITRPEASKYLDISLSTLDRLLRDEMIPYVKLRGRIYFTKKRLDEWLATLEHIPKEQLSAEALKKQLIRMEKNNKKLKREIRLNQLGEKIMSGEYADKFEESETLDEALSLLSEISQEEKEEEKEAREYLGISPEPEEEKKPNGMKPTRYITVDPSDPNSLEKAKREGAEARKKGERVSVHYQTAYSEAGRRKLDEERKKREEARRANFKSEHFETKRS